MCLELSGGLNSRPPCRVCGNPSANLLQALCARCRRRPGAKKLLRPERLADEDRRALDPWAARVLRQLTGYARTILCRSGRHWTSTVVDDDDVTQDALVLLLRYRTAAELLNSRGALLFKAAVFAASAARVRYWARVQRAGLGLVQMTRLEARGIVDATPAEGTIDLEDTLETLPPRWRDVLRRLGEGQTQTEVAREEGVTHQRIQQIVGQARKRLVAAGVTV